MRVGKIFGIDIYINVSWLFVFALVAWSLASNVGPLHAGNLQPTARAVLAVVTAFFFFASVLLHELAHSIVARLRGVPIRGITLFIFGGVAMLDTEAQSAPTELWVALVGPFMSLVLSLVFSKLALVISQGAAPVIPVHTLRMAWAVALSYLGYANVLLALFNVLPAYPLDGGRVLHAIIWRLTKNPRRAGLITGIVSRMISGAIMCLGIADTLNGDLSGGPWLTFVALFLFQAGQAEHVAVRIGSALQGHEAREIAIQPALRLAADSQAAAALSALLTQHVNAAPVYLGERFIGIVTLQDLVRVSEPELTYVTAAMTQAENIVSIAADADAGEVARRLSRSRTTMLPVVDECDDVIGFITREGVLDWIATSSRKSKTVEL